MYLQQISILFLILNTQLFSGFYQTCQQILNAKWTCWGSNTQGEGNTPEMFREHSQSISILSASIGRHYLCLIVHKLGSQQTLLCQGNNEFGQVQISQIVMESIVDVSAGDYHTCAIQQNMKSICFGLNNYGQLAIPEKETAETIFIKARNQSTCLLFNNIIECFGNFAVKNEIFEELKEDTFYFSLGYSHQCLVTQNIDCFGSNEFGQSTIPSSLTDIGINNTISYFHSQSNHNCASYLENLICWGQDDEGQVDKINQDQSYTQSETVTGIKHTCAKKHMQQVSCWGSNKYGATEVNSLVYEFIYNYSTSGDFTCIVKKSHIKCQGKHENKLNKVPDEVQNKIEEINSGQSHNCAVQNNSTQFKCWGLNDNHIFEPSDDFKSNLNYIYIINSGFKYTCIAFQNVQTLAHKNICFGLNSKGVLDVPSSIVDYRLIELSSGMEHTCAISQDQFFICWGSNDHNQLDAPLFWITEVNQVTAGQYHTCARRVEVWKCWGSNTHGQTDIPLRFMEGPVSYFMAGGSHNCGLDYQGLLFCWGSNRFHQLKVIRSQQGHYTNVELGMNHTCVANFNGKVKCVGDDQYGQVSLDEKTS